MLAPGLLKLTTVVVGESRLGREDAAGLLLGGCRCGAGGEEQQRRLVHFQSTVVTHSVSLVPLLRDEPVAAQHGK